MGCITACFGSKKHPTSSPVRANAPQSLSDGDAVKEALLSTQQRLAEEAHISVSAVKEKIDEDKLNVSSRKKVTFDLDVHIPPEECPIQEKAPIFSVDEVMNCLSEKRCKDEGDLVSDSTVSSLFSYPHGLEGKNCCTSSDGDDESVDMGFKNDGIESENKEKNGFESAQEETSESLFSLSIDSSKKISAVDVEVGEKEVSSPLKSHSTNRTARERSNYVLSVLNPIGNLGQRENVVRSKTTPVMMIPQEKENINLEQENAASGLQEEPRFLKDDTSLSSWLKVSRKDQSVKNSPDSVGNSSSSKQRTNSTPKGLENRPILGALTVNELKQVSKGSSSLPRGPRGHGTEEMPPAIGTVASYWRHTSEAIVGTDCKKVLSLAVLTMPF